MKKYQPIDCGDYDMLEIACMDYYEVKLELDSEIIIGVAQKLESRDGQEYFWLRNTKGVHEEVRIDRIQTMTVLTRPARFEMHRFAAEKT